MMCKLQQRSCFIWAWLIRTFLVKQDSSQIWAALGSSLLFHRCAGKKKTSAEGLPVNQQ